MLLIFLLYLFYNCTVILLYLFYNCTVILLYLFYNCTVSLAVILLKYSVIIRGLKRRLKRSLAIASHWRIFWQTFHCDNLQFRPRPWYALLNSLSH